MTGLSQWVAAGERGDSLWLGDVREACLRDSDCQKVVFRLTLCDGSRRDFFHAFPLWETEAEYRFVEDLACACVFNTLAALSGRELRFCFDLNCEPLQLLFSRVMERFQPDSPGYGKAVRVANRLCAAYGCGPFAFACEELSTLSPLPAPTEDPVPTDLSQRLRATAEKALTKSCCGIDVGGTDIKLALSRGGKLCSVKELDWNPAQSPTPEGLIGPIESLLQNAMSESGIEALDTIGLSFPDIVIHDRILGGETPKTKGMRDNPALDYESAFRELDRSLRAMLQAHCRPGGRVHLTNDGNMAAFCAAVELAHGSNCASIHKGVLAHSLGTDLGTGWLRADGSIPPLPLEMYDFLLDLGSQPQRALPPEDLRSVRNENSGLAGARRYLGQAAAFRLAYELDPSLLDGFTERDKAGRPVIPTQPRDMRKPCLEHLMALVESGKPEAAELFRQIGLHLGQVNREMRFILRPETESRFLFGRFLRSPRCFALLQEGCARADSGLKLLAADENLAHTFLMGQLAARESGAVARFGQAVGAIYYGLYEEDMP